MITHTPALTPPLAGGGAVGRTEGGTGGAKGTGVGTPCITWRFISTVPKGRGGIVRGPWGGGDGAGAGHPTGWGGAHDSDATGGAREGETITEGGVEAVATITEGGGIVGARASGMDHPEVGSSSTAMVRVRTRVTEPARGLAMGADGVEERARGLAMGADGVEERAGGGALDRAGVHASMRRSSASGAWCAPKGASRGSDTDDSSPPP
jgi:hypothetical protein